jgi:hypothetical protein
VKLLELSERKKHLKEKINALEINAKKILQTHTEADENLRMSTNLTKMV